MDIQFQNVIFWAFKWKSDSDNLIVIRKRKLLITSCSFSRWLQVATEVIYRIDPQALEIKILRTNQSGIPCLKNVEILGVASQNVTADEVQRTTSLWEKLSKTNLSTSLLSPLTDESETVVEAFEKTTGNVQNGFIDSTFFILLYYEPYFRSSFISETNVVLVTNNPK
jgi:hypothetical protein